MVWGRGGRRSLFSPASRSLSEPVPLGCDLLKCFSVPLLHLEREMSMVEGAKIGYSPTSKQVRLQWFPFLFFFWEGHGGGGKRENRGILQNEYFLRHNAKWLLSPFPLLEAGGDFSLIFTVRTWWGSQRLKKKKKKWGRGLRLGPHKFLTVKLVHTQPLVVCQLQLKFSYPFWAPVTFCSW